MMRPAWMNMMPTAVVSRIASRRASVSCWWDWRATCWVTSVRKFSVAGRPCHSIATAEICSERTSPVLVTDRNT